MDTNMCRCCGVFINVRFNMSTGDAYIFVEMYIFCWFFMEMWGDFNRCVFSFFSWDDPSSSYDVMAHNNILVICCWWVNFNTRFKIHM